MLAQERVAERRPIALVLPARIGHHPVEGIERACYEEVLALLGWRARGLHGDAILPGEKGEDGLAVADGLAVIDDVGQLPARRLRCIEDVLMRERHPGELQERVDL